MYHVHLYFVHDNIWLDTRRGNSESVDLPSDDFMLSLEQGQDCSSDVTHIHKAQTVPRLPSVRLEKDRNSPPESSL